VKLRDINMQWTRICNGEKSHPICGYCDWIVEDGELYTVVWFPFRKKHKYYLCGVEHHGESSCTDMGMERFL